MVPVMSTLPVLVPIVNNNNNAVDNRPPSSSGTMGSKRKLTAEEKKLAQGAFLRTFPIATFLSVGMCL